MAVQYTKEQLDTLDKEVIIQLFLLQQKQLDEIDRKLQTVLEQVAVLNRRSFGKSSKKSEVDNQIAFMEVDGTIVFFNEAEAVACQTAEETEEEGTKRAPKKTKGKKAADIKDLPVVRVEHKLTEEELTAEFGENGWYRLEDEVYSRYRFTPAKIEIEEHHVGVYKSRKDDHFRKAEHPGYLLRNSLLSSSLGAAVINAKYVNAAPFYRQEKEFERYGISITRAQMARWTIFLAEKYLSILYEYQPTRKASHPREFLKGFSGICISDGY